MSKPSLAPEADSSGPEMPPAKPAEPAEIKQGFRTTHQHIRGRHPIIRVLGYLSSMWSAAFLLGALIVVTGVATYYERDFGRELTAVMIYHSWWFNSLFALLALNIFGAAAVRFPWTKRQAGFVITHAGLLTVMFGFAVAGNDRLDGMLAGPQGEPAKIIEREREILIAVLEETGQRQDVVFEVTKYANYPGFWRYSADLFLRGIATLPAMGWLGDHRLFSNPEVSPVNQRYQLTEIAGHPIFIRRVVDTASPDLVWTPSSQGPSAVHFSLRTEGEAFGAESGRSRDILLPTGQVFRLGPLTIQHHEAVIPAALAQVMSEELPDDVSDMGRLVVFVDHGNGQHTVQYVPLTLPANEAATNDEMAIQATEPGSPFQIGVMDYVPHFEMDEEGQIQAPSDDPLAPLLFYRIGFGESAENLRWLNPIYADGLSFMPHQVVDGMWVLWQHPTAWHGLAQRPIGASIDVMRMSDDRHFLIRASQQRGVTFNGAVDGEWENVVNMGAGEITSTFKGFEPHVSRAPMPLAMEAMTRDRAANWIELQVGEGADAPRKWVRRNTAESITLPSGQQILLTYGREQYDLLDRHGFEITLMRFINEKDPGGQGNASYASDVRVRYSDGRPAQQYTISMNEPLYEGGVTLYQTARSEQPDGTFVSFFTVAQDPGRPFKYLGSLLLVAGIVTMYIMKMRKRKSSAA